MHTLKANALRELSAPRSASVKIVLNEPRLFMYGHAPPFKPRLI